MVHWFVLAGGCLLLSVVLQDAFEVMLLPRRVQRRVRLVRYFFHGTWAAWRAVAAAMTPGPRRERFLATYGALSMVVLFALWAVVLIVSFGLIQWSLESFSGRPLPFADALYMSGTTFFTLGYGDVLPKTLISRVVAVLEAGMGLGFLAVVIGYLPVLYQQFSNRESHVIQLDGRAGSPPTAVALICRHVESGGLDKLDDLLGDWESWGAELLESHLAYPMLAFYRSQHDDHSWLGGLTAIMDACALILVGVTEMKPLQARMTFSMARHVIVEMGRSLHVPVEPPGAGRSRVDRLSHQDFERLERLFAGAELGWEGGPATEETLLALRATYEPMLHQLADHLLIPLPAWVPADDEGADHWEQGRRGSIASRLVEELSDRTSGSGPTKPMTQEPTMAGRLRARLRR